MGAPARVVSNMKAVREVHFYCLRCFAPAREAGARSAACEACGYVTRPIDRRKYWNRNPHLQRLERSLKAGIVALVGIAGIVVFRAFTHAGTGAGWALATPLFPGVLLWHTASKLTRTEVYWHPATAWIALLSLFALVSWFVIADPTAAGVASGSCLLVAGFVWLAARRFAAWKRALQHGIRAGA